MVESIQGESASIPARGIPARAAPAVRQAQLLLLLDEVQCGVGRTGKFYAFEYAGVMPDAIAMAKGLGVGSDWCDLDPRPLH